MSRITPDRFFDGTTQQKFGFEAKNFDKNAALNRDNTLAYAYQSNVVLGPYNLELHTLTRLVNLTSLNQQLNRQLGQSRTLAKVLQVAEVKNLLNAYKVGEVHTLLAVDENGDVWGYRTVGAKLVLSRDKSVDKEVLERLFEENMTELPQRGRDAFTDLARKRARAPKNTAWDKLPAEAKNFAHQVNNLVKAHYGVERQSSFDLGAEFHVRRKAVCNYIASGLDFNPSLTAKEATRLALARLKD